MGLRAFFCLGAVLSFCVLPSVPAFSAEGEFAEANGYLAASYVYKDTSGDYCGVSESIYPYRQSGSGVQIIDDGIHYSIGGGIGGGPAVYGHASGDVKTYVYPSTQQIKTYNHAANSGIGPDYRMNGPLKLAWGSSGWGASRSQGYFYNVIHIEPGSSGLNYGDAVDLSFGFALEGSIHFNDRSDYEAQADVFMRTQLSDISDFNSETLNDQILPWRSRAFLGGEVGLTDPITGEELDLTIAEIEASLDTDFFIAPDDSIDYDSGDVTVSASVGDWLLYEGYLLSAVSLPNHSADFSISATADFFNTMNTSLLPGSGYEGIALAQKEFGINVAPEPVSCVLFPIGLTLFGLARRRQ